MIQPSPAEADARLAERARIERLVLRRLAAMDAQLTHHNAMTRYDAAAKKAELAALLAEIESGDDFRG